MRGSLLGLPLIRVRSGFESISAEWFRPRDESFREVRTHLGEE